MLWMSWFAGCAIKSTRIRNCCIRFAEWDMSSRLLNRLARSFTLQLNLWYASIFILSAGFLFLAIYLLLASAIQRQDREIIEARLKQYSAVLRSGGVPALRGWISRTGDAESQKAFFVRVVDP